MSKRITAILATVLSTGLVALLPGREESSRARLVQVSSIVLDKKTGSVDQIVEFGSGGFLTRDSTLTPLSSQSVETFDDKGKPLHKIGRFGDTPGTYYALRSIGVSREDGLIWVLDMKGRLSRFDANGALKSTMVIQVPGYNPQAMVIDGERGSFYLTGCVPQKVYLDLGCLLVHQYDRAKDRFKRSFLDTEPMAVKRHYLSIEDYQVDVAADGAVFAIDAPIRKVWKIDPGSGAVESRPMNSKLFEEIPELDPTLPQGPSAAYHLAERIFVTGSHVVVSVRKPKSAGYVLEVFDIAGRQTAMDLPSPGRLVGKSTGGGLWFVDTKAGNGQPFRLTKFKLAL